MVDGTPQIHVLARDPDDHFVEMPAIARSRTAPSHASSDRRSEFEHPTANALVGEVEATLGKQLLDIAIAQGEAKVQPHGVLDDGRRKTIPAIGGSEPCPQPTPNPSDPAGCFPDSASWSSRRWNPGARFVAGPGLE